jgi:N-acetyl-gamma-glutamyl-phosphate reductase
MVASVFIDGAAGTTGLDIAERLSARSDVSIVALDEARRKDPAARAEALRDSDFAILCLPDDAAREAAALAQGSRVRLIDASTAHRTAAGWAYGFAELAPGQRATIAGAARVSNPGCYPTGFLALVAPLVQRSLIPAGALLTCHAVSGYSGGGKALIARFEKEERDIAWRGYALGLDHKHVPEMQRHAGLAHPPIFAPAVVPAYRGMVVEVPLHRSNTAIAPADELKAAWIEHFAQSPLVSVGGLGTDGELLLRSNPAPDDRLVIDLFASADGQQIRMVAMLDNLGKGAGGACVHNLNLMAGLEETAGLRLA